MTDEGDLFFREATLRICGSLDIEKSLRRTFTFITRHMPADEMRLYVYDREGKALRSIASAGELEPQSLVRQIGLPAAACQQLESGERTRVLLIARMHDHPVGQPVAQALRLPASSALVVILELDDQEIGALVMHVPGVARYSQEHASLLAQLNEPCAIALMNSLRYRELQKVKKQLADDNRFLHRQLRQPSGQEIIGADFGLKGVMDLVREVAPLPSPILFLGETGTGKEVLAAAAHNLSARRDGPFIKVNCGAIPPTLLDSELFGHEKGAFTGALSRKPGLLERADGGTIFLDEVGELPLSGQVRLLRVLQDKQIERVGGTEPIDLDLRVIAATHRDLEEMIRQGTFRQDLYFRLLVFPISIPTLSHRKSDIPVLVQHFIRKKSQELGLVQVPPLAPGALDRLMAYSWPGNVRELENVVERALILSRGEGSLRFDSAHLAEEQQAPALPIAETDEDQTLDAVNARHIRKVMALTHGRVEGATGAARLLGIHPSTLRNRMRKLGIEFGTMQRPVT